MQMLKTEPEAKRPLREATLGSFAQSLVRTGSNRCRLRLPAQFKANRLALHRVPTLPSAFRRDATSEMQTHLRTIVRDGKECD
jgi:hypothetical protein